MSAVFERDASLLRARPLIGVADPGRTFAWQGARAIDVATFLGDVAAAAAALPAAPAAVNLCEDRYAFLVAFCALACRGQTNLLPPSRAALAVDETLAAHPGSYALGEVVPAARPRHFVRLPPPGSGSTARLPPLADDQLVAIGYTSGSTGQPKAHPKRWAGFQASTAANVRALTEVLELTPDRVAHVVATVPPQHMYGIELSILLPLLGPFAVHRGRPLLPADIAAALAEVPAPRVLVTTPVHLRALLADPVALPPLGAITSATAPLPRELAAAAEARYGAPVLEFFGSTETCVIAERRTAHEADWRLRAEVSLRPQPDGTLVDATWLEHPVGLSDLVELLPRRRFRLRGRQADLVDIAGKRASLAELTRRLLALPGILDAAVFQLDTPDPIGVRRIAALVVAPERSEADLVAELRHAIDPVFLPRPLRKVAALPRNDTGKLPRAALLAALRGEG